MALIQMEFRSATLKRSVTLNVILPSEQFRGPYPTLYLLHGLSGNSGRWMYYTNIRYLAESKGIADAAEICKRANAVLGRDVFRLEVYGNVAPEYQEDFEALCAREEAVMRYCGVKNADAAVETLSRQFVLLFPTYYEGECFAGTVLDAFLSRTPIIANDWKYNGEVIRDGENGFLYPYRDIDAAAERLVALYQNPALYARIQAGCEASARAFDSDCVLETLANKFA